MLPADFSATQGLSCASIYVSQAIVACFMTKPGGLVLSE